MHKGKKNASALQAGTPLMRELLKTLPSGTLPPIPAHFGHGYDFGKSGWLMLGNGPDDTVFPGFQGCGDCVWAGGVHEEREASYQAHRPIPKFSGRTVVEQYSEYSGYDPQTGANDNGSDVQEVLRWRQTKGLRDDDGHTYKIGQHVSLAPGDLHELWAATYLFECVGIGVQLQDTQEQNFPATWDYDPSGQTVGGHYVPIMGDNGLISWACRVGFTQTFYKNLNDEAYCWIDPQRYNVVTGETSEHHTDQDLEKYIVLVARQKAQ